MKSSAEVKSLNRKMSRLGVLSLVTVMALFLSVGNTLSAAEPGKLQYWQRPKAGAKKEPLTHLSDKKEQAEAMRLLHDEPAGFMKKFQSQPFQVAEALQRFLLTAADEGKLDEAKEALKKVLSDKSKVPAGDFGVTDKNLSKRDGYLKLLEKVLGMSEEDLSGEDFLKEAFGDASIALSLGLSDDATDGSDKPGTEQDERLKRLEDQMKTLAPMLGAEFNAINKKIDELDKKKAEPEEKAERVGEAPGATDAAQVMALCDYVNKMIKKSQEDAVSALEPKLKAVQDQINATYDRAEALSRLPDRFGTPKSNNGMRLEDILPSLLADAQGKNQGHSAQQQPAFNPAMMQPQRQQPQPAPNNNGNDALSQPLAPREEMAQQPYQPLQIPQLANNTQTRPISLNLPYVGGRSELMTAEQQYTALQMRQPVTASLTATSTLPELVMGKARVSGDLKRTQAALMAAKTKASAAEEALDELKEGARAALPEWVKRQENQYQDELNRLKQQYQTVQQQAQQAAAQNPEARDMAQGQVFAMADQVQKAESQLSNFRNEIELKVESGNTQIKTVARLRDRLNTAASKLESEVSGLKEEETAVQQLVNSNMQMQLAQINNQNAGPGIPQTPNVNNILRLGGQNGGGRRPIGLGAAATSSPLRGGLASPAKAMATP